jgi:hypothetical protein
MHNGAVHRSSWVGRVVAWIEKQPAAAFALFCAVHILIWTLLPSVLYPNLPLDLNEALTYGPEWQLGYDKLPPLPWWLVEIMHQLIGTDWSYYLLAQLVIVATFAIIWVTALPLVGTSGALVSVLIADGLHYYNFTAPKFNHDVIQLPFWALATFALYRALRTGRLWFWVLTGLALGIAFWAKYFVPLLAIPMALFVLAEPTARRVLATPGPYVAIAVGLLVVSPHLVWLITHDFLPLQYVDVRFSEAKSTWDHLKWPGIFLAGQFFWLIPSFFIALPLVQPRATSHSTPADKFDWWYFTTIVFLPAILLLASSLVSGRRLITMWGYPFWLFLGLWMVMTARVLIDRERLERVIVIWSIVTICYALAFMVDYLVMPFIGTHYRTSLFPGDRLAQEITQRYQAVTGRRLAYVIGDMWLAGNIHNYGATHPRAIIDGKLERVPWVDPADLRARGAVVVWTADDRDNLPPPYRTGLEQGAQIQPPFDLPMRWGHGIVKVGWAIVPAAP